MNEVGWSPTYRWVANIRVGIFCVSPTFHSYITKVKSESNTEFPNLRMDRSLCGPGLHMWCVGGERDGGGGPTNIFGSDKN